MMRDASRLAALLALIGHPHPKASPAKPLHPLSPLAPPPTWVHRAALPMLPSVARVRLEVARDRVVVSEDVALPRGGWTGGGLDFHAAFGAPGTPIAVDAKIGPGSAGGDGRTDEPGDPVLVEPVASAPGVRPLLGSSHMAGIWIRVRDAQLRRAFAAGDLAILRIRSLLVLPAPDATGRRDVVVRLGAPDGTPLTLGHIQVVSLDSKPWITRAEASLCGPDADPWPLAVTVTPRPVRPGLPAQAPIAPAMAVRHASDDLCIRWWSTD